MKIALCFSGGIRNFEDNFPSIKKHIIDPLQPDIFIHGWYFKINEIQNQHKIYKGKETEFRKVYSLLKPKKIKLEFYNKQKEDELAIKFNVKEIQEKYKDNVRLTELYPNTVGMFWSIYESNRLKSKYENENNFKYDYVIRIRPDFEFYNSLNLNVLDNVKDKTLLFPLDNYAFITKQCDKFAIGTSKDMDCYSELILSMNKYIIKYPKFFWDGPSIMDKHLKDNNIILKWIYIDYDYHVRKKSQRLTKDKFELVKYDDKLYITQPTKFNF